MTQRGREFGSITEQPTSSAGPTGRGSERIWYFAGGVGIGAIIGVAIPPIRHSMETGRSVQDVFDNVPVTEYTPINIPPVYIQGADFLPSFLIAGALAGAAVGAVLSRFAHRS